MELDFPNITMLANEIRPRFNGSLIVTAVDAHTVEELSLTIYANSVVGEKVVDTILIVLSKEWMVEYFTDKFSEK